MLFKNKTEFIFWAERQLRTSIYLNYIIKVQSPNKAEANVKSLLIQRFPDIVIPSPYSDGGWNGLTNYLGKIWDRNEHLLISHPVIAQSECNRNTKTEVEDAYSSHSQIGAAPSKPNRNIKAEVADAYSYHISRLEKVSDLFNRLSLSNPELKIINSVIQIKLGTHLKEIKEERKYAFSNMIWDNLVIGFFGETNAGKSTIIESLRILLHETSRENQILQEGDCDGIIVGDGRQDFTQDYHEYTMKVNGHPFILVDVPGIEGKENLYSGKIGEALRKAHLIFYVNGHNKSIDAGTASKVRKYMGDSVKLVAIQNIRGNASQYEEAEDRITLQTQSTKTILRGLENDFRNLIGDKFHGAIPVQGLLAMCSYAKFSPKRNDLSNKQNILMEMFGEDCHNNSQLTRERIKEFSNINKIIELIHAKSTNFLPEIAYANFAKIETILRRTVEEYVAEIEEKKGKFELYRNQVSRFIRENKEAVDSSVKSVDYQLNNKLREIITQLTETTDRAITNNNLNSLDSIFRTFKQNLQNSFKEIIRQQSNSLVASVSDRASRLKAIPGFYATTIHMDDINITSGMSTYAIKKEDEISFGDVVTSVASTAVGAKTGAFIGHFFGPLGIIIGGAIGGFGGLVAGNISASEKQTNRARTKAKEIISNYRRTVIIRINSITQEYRSQAEAQINQINAVANTRIKEVDRFYQTTIDAENILRQSLQKLSNNGKKQII